MNEFAPPDDRQENSAAVPETEPASPAPAASEQASETMQQRKWAFRFFLAIGIFAVTMVLKMQTKDETNRDVKQKAYAAFAEYEDQAQIRRLIDKHHARAFEAAFSLGRRNSSTKFDQHKYLRELRNAIHADLAWESGSMRKMIHDARFGDKNDPIRLPDEIMKPPADKLHEYLPTEEEEEAGLADPLQLPPNLRR